MARNLTGSCMSVDLGPMNLVHHRQEEGWVVCRVFKKRTTTVKRASDLESPCWYDDQVSLIHEIGSCPRRILQQEILHQPSLPCRQELENHYSLPQEPFLQLPQLQSPTLSHSGSSNINGLGFGFDSNQGASPQMVSYEHQQQSHMSLPYDNSANQAADQVTDWRVLDKFVASQLSQEDASEGTSFTDAAGFHLPDMNLLQQANDQEAQERPLPSGTVEATHVVLMAGKKLATSITLFLKTANNQIRGRIVWEDWIMVSNFTVTSSNTQLSEMDLGYL
ncbi:NAC domain-containing protein 7 [Nymphaea thermarum]|nr:NAC domain-containing protein 7 [Nymphaea thermarum]